MNQYDKDVALNAVLYVAQHVGGSLDMLREAGDAEEYAEYVANKLTLESSFC